MAATRRESVDNWEQMGYTSDAVQTMSEFASDIKKTSEAPAKLAAKIRAMAALVKQADAIMRLNDNAEALRRAERDVQTISQGILTYLTRKQPMGAITLFRNLGTSGLPPGLSDEIRAAVAVSSAVETSCTPDPIPVSSQVTDLELRINELMNLAIFVLCVCNLSIRCKTTSVLTARRHADTAENDRFAQLSRADRLSAELRDQLAQARLEYQELLRTMATIPEAGKGATQTLRNELDALRPENETLRE